MIKIEKKVPIPEITGRQKYPFAQMNVGDSFYAEGVNYNNLMVAASAWRFTDCESQREGNTLYCGSHNFLLRKEARNFVKRETAKKMKRNYTLPKSQKPLKKRSDKRKLEEQIYLKLLGPWLKDKICGVRGCGKPATQCHHQKGREGKLLLDTKFWLPVCRFHHAWLTEDSAWAIREGYSVSRTSN